MNPRANSQKYNPRHSFVTAPPIRPLLAVSPVATFLFCLRHPTLAASGRAIPLVAHSQTHPQRNTIPIATS